MIKFKIPGFDPSPLKIEYLVFDYNGTLAIDGQLIPGVKERLNQLSDLVNIFVLTADTFGSAAGNLKDVNCELLIVDKKKQDKSKLALVRDLGDKRCICIGNGRNDRLMLREAAIGIGVLQDEGASADSLMNSDVVVRNILDAFDLLLNPKRLTATLRI